MTETPTSRRHDLDALRAAAMLLGIAVHASLSFVAFPWMVQDTRQHEAFGLFFFAVHGFRMPVFFLLSGFFTAMLWRRRGLKALMWHRFRRIVLPMLLGLITIVPAVNWVSAKTIGSGMHKAPASGPAEEGAIDFWAAVRAGNVDAVSQHLAGDVDVNEQHDRLGVTPLALATLAGRIEVMDLLLRHAADVNARNRDGSTALHGAAFMGRTEAAELLVRRGADTQAKDYGRQTPFGALAVDWELTQFIAAFLQIELNKEKVLAGRVAVAEQFGAPGNDEPRPLALFVRLIFIPVFHHLWFLWFLCWLVVGFAVYAAVSDRLKWKRQTKRLRWLVLSPGRFLWLLPLTMIPQAFMGLMYPTFGADISAGILPMPHVLAYYAIFFGFGALYFDCDDVEGRVGRWWWLTLPLTLLVIFPLGLDFTFGGFGWRDQADPAWHRLIAVATQVIYAWMMTFALMGMFRRLLARQGRMVRYVADSSYWLYLAHLPLIIGAQALVRDWPAPALVKCAAITIVVTGLLLATYHVLVRYTWLGTLLNGPRQRRVQPDEVSR